MPQDLVFEIGVEELPASYIEPALKQLGEETAEFLKNARLAFKSVHTAGTPRRLALQVFGLQEKQPDKEEEVQGPSAKAAFDEHKQPTQVAAGFAKSRGVELKDLRLKSTPKGDYVVATVRQKGRPAADLLQEWLPDITRRLAFPKSMRWGTGGPLRFARPITWLCALLGPKPLSFKLDFLKAEPKTFGHRFLAPKAFPLKKASEYTAVLAKAHVILEQAEREAAIRAGLKVACAGSGLAAIADADLESICANLVEYPAVILGKFDPAYLVLPEEVIITTLREHQRYFAARDKAGKLAPVFLVAANGTQKNLDGVRQGNARVLTARLEDAKFFFHEDQKTKLEAKLEDLKHVVWLESFGTLFDKAQRLRKLAGWLAGQVDPAAQPAAERAALLCKCDLVTNVVGEKEFTSLQGVMGGIYARLSGEGEEVAAAIGQHYKPAFAGDSLPAGMAGRLVSLADKLDNIVGCFSAGIVPSGSQDPYALRRQATAVMAILAGLPKDLSLQDCLSQAAGLLASTSGKPAMDLKLIKDLFRQRLENMLSEQGYPFDLVAAVSRRFDLVREAVLRAKALAEARKNPGFEAMAQAFSRVNNILAKAPAGGAVDQALLAEGAEIALYRAHESARGEVERLCQAGQFSAALEVLAGLKPAIDAYFDQVMVMDENQVLRQNRLSMLAQIAAGLNRIADFTKLVKK